MEKESYRKNREDGKFCRKCVWHFRLSPNLTGCEYHLCNDHGRGCPAGPGCSKFLKGNPKIRQNMIDPSERNVRIKLGVDPRPKPKAKPEPKPEMVPIDLTAPRPYKIGGKHPPSCYIPEPVKQARKSMELDMELFLELLEDRVGLYGMNKETGIATGTIARWKKSGRISVTMAERLRLIYGVDVIRKEQS
jgi:hypothetical protein